MPVTLESGSRERSRLRGRVGAAGCAVSLALLLSVPALLSAASVSFRIGGYRVDTGARAVESAESGVVSYFINQERSPVATFVRLGPLRFDIQRQRPPTSERGG